MRARLLSGSKGGADGVWDPAGPGRPDSDSRKACSRPGRDGSFACPGAPSGFSGDTSLSISPDRARGGVADREGRSNRSCSEALAAGTMGDRIRIGDLEAAFLEVVAVIQEGTAHEKRTLGIDHDADIGRLHHDVAISGTIHQIHFILQS